MRMNERLLVQAESMSMSWTFENQTFEGIGVSIESNAASSHWVESQTVHLSVAQTRFLSLVHLVVVHSFAFNSELSTTSHQRDSRSAGDDTLTKIQG